MLTRYSSAALCLLLSSSALLCHSFSAPKTRRVLSSTPTTTTLLRVSVNSDVNGAKIDESGEVEPTKGVVNDYLTNLEKLCQERNLPLENVKNSRDLASVGNSPIKPGRIFRTGRLSDASSRDCILLLGDLDVETIVDLRSPTELKDDPTLQNPEVFEEFANLVWTERGRGKDGCLRELGENEPIVKKRFSRWKPNKDADNEIEQVMEAVEVVDDDCFLCEQEGGVSESQFLSGAKRRKERHFVSLMNEFKYVRGTLSKVRKRDIARTVLKSPGALVSKRVRSSVKEPFLDKINDGGLPMLNELLLQYGAPGIKYVLELCSDPARHPIAFHCTAGKDRTGVIAAIMLAFLGVPDEDIIEDYALSANVYAEMNDHKAMVGALSQRNLDPKTFLGAPPQVMQDTLNAIREDYGSVEGYMDWIGFGPEKQERLKKALIGE